MKKTVIRIVALSLAVMMLGAMLVACGTISGTYKGSADVFGLAGADVTYKFSGKKVTITVVANVLGFEKTTTSEGTYVIEKADDGTQTITFTFENEDASSYNGTLPFEKTDDGIKIGDVEYKKQ